ncbi:hypothetical protein GCM10025881_22950 [Pseudolysinimonas kribbensis]|uniref:Uncharacterized protein n=1 Tax=Pseudolysinimonas kribbensis TaxID=433641 RepID=A0ABQ6K4C0_9MICO|nr:hypothetical protein GCM10025881_22950 [Pseudolysinimonas kribbensis]
MADEPESRVAVDDDIAVDDEAVPDSGTQGDDGEAVEAAPDPEPVLRLGERDDVVLDDDRKIGLVLDHAPEGHVLPSEERGAAHGAVVGNQSADPDPDGRRGRQTPRDARHQLADLACDGARFLRCELHRLLSDHVGTQVRDDGAQVGARQLHPDEMPRVRHDIQRPRWPPGTRCLGSLVELDEQTALDQRSAQSGQGSRREI